MRQTRTNCASYVTDEDDDFNYRQNDYEVAMKSARQIGRDGIGRIAKSKCVQVFVTVVLIINQ